MNQKREMKKAGSLVRLVYIDFLILVKPVSAQQQLYPIRKQTNRYCTAINWYFKKCDLNCAFHLQASKTNL